MPAAAQLLDSAITQATHTEHTANSRVDAASLLSVQLGDILQFIASRPAGMRLAQRGDDNRAALTVRLAAATLLFGLGGKQIRGFHGRSATLGRTRNRNHPYVGLLAGSSC
jgi:hypothetical protein